MAQYIPKAAVVAEIERLREQDYPCDTFEESNGYYNALDEIATFLDTLEVKEVDIEKELNDYGYHYDYVSLADRKELVDFAKYFFELGLKAQNRDNE